MSNGWDAFVVSFYRGVIGLLFVLGWLALRPSGSGLANYKLWLWSMPVTASLFGVVVLNESLVGLQIVGMALILLTATAMSVQSSVQQDSSTLDTD